MPRLLKRALPITINPFKEVPDNVLSVVEYASLGYLLSQHGYSNANKFMAVCVIGITYETYLNTDIGIFGQKLGGDNDKHLRARNN